MSNKNVEDTMKKENTNKIKSSGGKSQYSHTEGEPIVNQYDYQYYKFDEDPDEEQKDNNIFYEDMKKHKILVALKRAGFCAVLLIILMVVALFASGDGSNGVFSIFDTNSARTEEVNELKVKVIQYEEKIEELERELEELRQKQTEESED